MSTDWEGIYGQKKVIKILEGFVASERKPQALIFNGSNGVGKDFIASRFSFLLNKSFLSENVENRFSEPTMKFIFPLPKGKGEESHHSPYEKLSESQLKNVKSELLKKKKNPYYNIDIEDANVIKINSIREINKFITQTSSNLNYRTVLISNAHLMSDEAQNALLKSLEEPPPGIIFVLTTDRIQLLKETILSRCWQINFQPLEHQELEDILTNYFNFDSQTLSEIIPFCEGSVRHALNLLENDFLFIKEKAITILRHSMASKFHTSIKEISYFLKDGMESSFHLLLKVILYWLNEVVKHRNQINVQYFIDDINTFEKFNSKYSDVDINKCISRIENLFYLSENTNVNKSIIANNIITQLSLITDLK
ncbi:MAG: hypothetical protein KF721_12885 [Ignavibacteriaceae bacterium]|nr:hypothetical protein [Ignavibacteriaceae bacterium]